MAKKKEIIEIKSKNEYHQALLRRVHVWVGILLIMIGLIILLKYSWIAGGIIIVVGIVLIAWKKRETNHEKK